MSGFSNHVALARSPADAQRPARCCSFAWDRLDRSFLTVVDSCLRGGGGTDRPGSSRSLRQGLRACSPRRNGLRGERKHDRHGRYAGLAVAYVQPAASIVESFMFPYQLGILTSVSCCTALHTALPCPSAPDLNAVHGHCASRRAMFMATRLYADALLSRRRHVRRPRGRPERSLRIITRQRREQSNLFGRLLSAALAEAPGAADAISMSFAALNLARRRARLLSTSRARPRCRSWAWRAGRRLAVWREQSEERRRCRASFIIGFCSCSPFIGHIYLRELRAGARAACGRAAWRSASSYFVLCAVDRH
jgi:hypothetical protein